MSSTNIIAKITEIYDRNIEFDQDFFKNETIRGVEHTVIKGKLTYIPDSCDHCNGENKDYMIVKNGNQTMDILIGQFNSKPVILRLTKQRFYCKYCGKTFMAQTPFPPEFETAINTLYGYKDAIVNSLETGYTNAVVEGNNNLIKSIKKTAFGFRSFQNLRLRVLLRKKIHIKKKDNIKDTIYIQDAVA